MTDKHLSEKQIQQYVLNELVPDESFKKHLQTCAHCRAMEEAYTTLFSTIKQEPKPVFDFEVSNLVVAQLPKPAAKKETSFLWPLVSIAFGMVLAIIWGFKKVLLNVFANLSTIAIGLVILSAVLLLIFQVFDLYKQNQQQLNLLNSL